MKHKDVHIKKRNDETQHKQKTQTNTICLGIISVKNRVLGKVYIKQYTFNYILGEIINGFFCCLQILMSCT